MADRASIEKIIRDAYAARAAKDLDAIARIFKPDGVFHLAGSPATFPGAARAEGEAQLRTSLSSLIQAFDFLEQTLLTSVIEGNKAAMHWRVKVKHNSSGEAFVTELFELWTIDGGRVASLVQFCDTALVASFMARR
jgi:ketosteroid isomerase-like protein